MGNTLKSTARWLKCGHNWVLQHENDQKMQKCCEIRSLWLETSQDITGFSIHPSPSYHWKTWWCLWSPCYFPEWCLCTSPLGQEQWKAQSAQKMCAWLPRLFPTQRTHHHTPFLFGKRITQSLIIILYTAYELIRLDDQTWTILFSFPPLLKSRRNQR